MRRRAATPTRQRPQRRWLACVASTVALLLFMSAVPSLAAAATSGTLKATSASGGVIKGSAKNNAMKIVSVKQRLKTTLASKGRTSGKRTHGVLEVTIEIDRSMPLFMQAWANAENFSKLTVTMNGKTGYILDLKNAALAEVRMDSVVGPSGVGKDQLVLSFTYQRIDWKFGSIEASDDWSP